MASHYNLNAADYFRKSRLEFLLQVPVQVLVMSSSWNFLAPASLSCEGSEPSQAELGQGQVPMPQFAMVPFHSEELPHVCFYHLANAFWSMDNPNSHLYQVGWCIPLEGPNRSDLSEKGISYYTRDCSPKYILTANFLPFQLNRNRKLFALITKFSFIFSSHH